MPGPCALCNEPSSLICSGCKLVHYCGKDHQRIHWKQGHKTDCRPSYRVEENEKMGRHLVADKNIRKGEIILRESPLVVGPKSVTLPLCLGCHRLCDADEYVECDGCGFPLCSPRCQVSDYHVDECRLMMEAGFRASINVERGKKEISYFPIVPLRCLLLRNSHPERFERLLSLQSHLEEREKTPLFDVYKKNVAGFIRDRLRRKDFSEKDILTVSGILDTNAFQIEVNKAKFRGLYNVASMMAHNCTPNTRHSFLRPEMTIVVAATKDILPGEIISATYTQTFWDTQSRREHLKSSKCFDCDCERCSDPTELGTYMGAIRCSRCTRSEDDGLPGAYMLPVNPLESDTGWRCESCGHEIASKQIKSGNRIIREELRGPTMKTVQGLEGFLEKYGAYGAGVLHPNNFNVVQVKHALIQMIGNSPGYFYSEVSEEILDRKMAYCRELLDLVDVLEPGLSRIRGEILNELQGSMAIKTKRQFEEGKIDKDEAQKNLSNAMVVLKEAMDILKMYYLNADEFEGRLLSLAKVLED